MNAYEEFLNEFKQMIKNNTFIVENTLSNIFTMRLIGNKTHGDLAEVGIAEFVNQFMPNYSGRYVGKELYRSKKHEEDIVVTNKSTKTEIPISLKAYGDGPLQLSTDKKSKLFKLLKNYGTLIDNEEQIAEIFNSEEFKELMSVNVMPLIYRERDKECNIMVFDYGKMVRNTSKIKYIIPDDDNSNKRGKRKHPIYAFYDADENYICEVRYGGTDANALQRGFWTNTTRAKNYFTSITDGWIKYEHNLELIKLIRLALNSTPLSHVGVNGYLQQNIEGLKNNDKNKKQ